MALRKISIISDRHLISPDVSRELEESFLNEATSSIKPITNYICPDQKFPHRLFLRRAYKCVGCLILSKLLHTKSCSCTYSIYRPSTATAGTIDEVSENIKWLELTDFSTGKLTELRDYTLPKNKFVFLIEKIKEN